jgi:hypothetical protein
LKAKREETALVGEFEREPEEDEDEDEEEAAVEAAKGDGEEVPRGVEAIG